MGARPVRALYPSICGLTPSGARLITKWRARLSGLAFEGVLRAQLEVADRRLLLDLVRCTVRHAGWLGSGLHQRRELAYLRARVTGTRCAWLSAGMRSAQVQM